MNADLPRVALRSVPQPGDTDLIVDLHARGYAGEGDRYGPGFLRYVRETVEESLVSPARHTRVWFAEQGDETVGCAAMVDRGTCGQLRWVVLLPQARGSGTGKALLDAALHHAVSVGWRRVYLETTDGLDTSMALYQRLGFKVVADDEKDLWDGRGREIVMELLL